MMAILPFMLYQLAGFGTLHFVVSRSVNWVINIAILALIIAGYVAYREGAYDTERILTGLLVLGLLACCGAGGCGGSGAWAQAEAEVEADEADARSSSSARVWLVAALIRPPGSRRPPCAACGGSGRPARRCG